MKHSPFFIRTFLAVLIITQAITGCVLAASPDTGKDLLSSVSDALDHSLVQIDQNLTGIADAFGVSDLNNSSVTDIISPFQIHQEGVAGVILLAGDAIYP